MFASFLRHIFESGDILLLQGDKSNTESVFTVFCVNKGDSSHQLISINTMQILKGFCEDAIKSVAWNTRGPTNLLSSILFVCTESDVLAMTVTMNSHVLAALTNIILSSMEAGKLRTLTC